ncbi:hypothetical protein XENOCAPTIV_013746, partial [Xenoophorus captivus]
MATTSSRTTTDQTWQARDKTCVPLIKALQNGIQKRFGPMMKDPELAAAAVLLPKFKASWTDRADVIEA